LVAVTLLHSGDAANTTLLNGRKLGTKLDAFRPRFARLGLQAVWNHYGFSR
jgi:hypothetical protein